MSIPLPTIDKLIQEALANHAQKPDYAAFCLSEAHEQLTAFQNEMDADHKRRWSDIHARIHIASELNSSDYDPEYGSFWIERLNARKETIKEWEKLAHAWHNLFHDDKRAMECANNTFLFEDDGFTNLGTIFYHMMYAKLIKDIFGAQSGYFQSTLKDIENKSSEKPQFLSLMATEIVSIAGKEYLKNAIRCLQRAETIARETGDWTGCALAWTALKDKIYLKNGIRCLRHAEDAVRDTGDWIDCAGSWLYLTGMKWNNNAQRCMSSTEILAKRFYDWQQCWQFYQKANKPKDAERCLRLAETKARETGDWISCASAWFSLAGEKWNDNVTRCFSAAEGLATTPADWQSCCLSYLEVNNCEEAERCLEIMGGFEPKELNLDPEALKQRIRDKRAELAKDSQTK